jgi:hypothetical protein
MFIIRLNVPRSRGDHQRRDSVKVLSQRRMANLIG